MRIRIITCHNVYNCGASLQAYALSQYLRKQGCDVEIIDYQPDYLSRHYRLSRVDHPSYERPLLREFYLAAKLPERLMARRSRKKKEFDDFRERFLPLTGEQYSSFEELAVHPPEADLYIAGSDQIWNPLFPNGWDPAFYLGFVTKGRKISYAASFGTTTIPDGAKDRILKNLPSFDTVSVREESGREWLMRLEIEAETVADPVFLFDQKEWLSLLREEEEEKTNEPYVFVYDFDRSETVREIAKKEAVTRGCGIRSYFRNAYADQIDESGPIGFLRNIAGASCVISNSYHATAFALIFHRDLFVVPREEDLNTRLEDLLRIAGVSDRLAGTAEKAEKAVPVDWDTVDQRLGERTAQSKEFLQKEVLV